MNHLIQENSYLVFVYRYVQCVKLQAQTTFYLLVLAVSLHVIPVRTARFVADSVECQELQTSNHLIVKPLGSSSMASRN